MLEGLAVLPKDKVDSAIIFLHGYGDSAQGFIRLASYFSGALPNSYMFFADACEPFEQDHLSGRQWFSLINRSQETLERGLSSAYPHIVQLIDKIKSKYNLNYNKIALVGFSQGAMTSFYTGLALPNDLAGVVGYSGALILPPQLNQHKKLKVSLIHGTHDDVVSFVELGKAEMRFKELGVDVEIRVEEGLGHTISEEGIEFGINRLKDYFGG